VTPREETTRAAMLRQQALAALFAYLQIEPHSHPLVLFTRFAVVPEAECSEGFFVAVDDRPYEVYHLCEGGYDVESADDPSPTFAACSDEEKIRQFACAVALHAHGITVREASAVEALVSEPPPGDLAPGHGRSFRVTFRSATDATDRVTEVVEIPLGEAREFVALGDGARLPVQRAAEAERTLLILGCSARKRPTLAPLPAIERYDGPLYRVLRKALREGAAPQPLDILIISARYGLLRGCDLVELYDQRMTRRQAEWLREEIGVRIAAELSGRTYRHAHISLGADYLAALGGAGVIAGYAGRTSLASGGLGQRQSQLRDWLLRTR
jgi:hypothetical protein